MKAEGADQLTQEEIAAQLRTLVQAGYETPGCGMAVRINQHLGSCFSDAPIKVAFI